MASKTKAAPQRAYSIQDLINEGIAYTPESTEATAAADPQTRTWGQAVGDTAVQLAEGVNTTLGAAPSIVAPDGAMAGFFRDNADYWRDKQSDVLKQRIAATDQRIQEAGKEGVLSQIGTAASEYWNDPAQAARLVATNLPSMAATLGTGALAGAAAKGAAAARGLSAAKEAALVAQYGTRTAMAANAALNAGGARGEAYEDLKRAALAQGMSPEQAEQAALDGSIMPGVVGGVAGAVSGKLGLEKALLGQPGAGAGTALRRAAGAFGAELAGEQIEEVAPKLTTNYEAGRIDPARSLTDDLGRTMVETAIGAGPGAVVAGGVEGVRTPAQEAADAIRANEKLPESGALTKAVNAGVEAKAQAVGAGAPLLADDMAQSAPDSVDDPVRDRILALPDGARQDALRAYAVVNRTDVAKGVVQYNRKLLDRLLTENQPSLVLGERLTDTDMGAMLGGGGMMGSTDPLMGALGMNRESQANSITNVAQAAESRPPMPASDAARMLDEARNRGLDLAVVEHPNGGFVLIPPTWVTPDMAAQGEARLNETIARMQQADAAPVERAPRANTAPVDLNLPTDPVQNYMDTLRTVNTPAARVFVQDFDAGRVTPADVQKRMAAEQGVTPEQRLARAASEAPKPADPVADRLRSAAAQSAAAAPTDILNPQGLPFKTKMAADLAAKKAPGAAVLPVNGGFVVRPQESVSVQNVPQASEAPQAATAISQPDQTTQAVGAQPAGPAAGVPAEGVGAVEAAGVEATAGAAIAPSLFSDPRTGTPVVVPNKATADAMARSKQLSGKVAVRKATPAEMADDRNAFTGYNAGEVRRMGYVLEMLQPQVSRQNKPQTKAQQAQAATENVAPDAEQSPAQETTHNGTRIYPTKVKVGDEVKPMWAVESPDNQRRRAAGERTIGGDSLHDSIEQAKAAAERESKRDAEQRAAKAEQDAADKARLDAEEARKAANRPKTVVERRKDAILDGPSKIGQGTKRAVIATAVDSGYVIEAKMVYDHAAKKRDQEAVDRASRAGYILGVSNENLPLVKAGNEAKARLKEGKYEKPEYRVYQGSDTKAPFREITKTEYDYAQELKAQRAAAPQAAESPALQSAMESAGWAGETGQNDTIWTKRTNGERYTALLSPDAGSMEITVLVDAVDTQIASFKVGDAEAAAEAANKAVARDVAEQSPADDFLPEGWTKTVNGYTKRPVYRMEQGVGQPFAVVTQAEGMTYEVQIRHGDKQLTTGTQRGALSEVLAAAEAELGRMKQADSVTHADPGEKAEAATPAVVTDSLKKAARNEDTKPSEMRKWLVGKIDEAIAVAPEAAVDFLSFDVPGDGTFKVQNSQARLQEFRKKVMASPGFKDSGQRQNTQQPEQTDSALNGSGSTVEAIRNFLADGDVQGAVEYARLKGVDFTPVAPQLKLSPKGKEKHMPASVKSSVPSVADGLTQVEAEQLNQYLTAEQARAETAAAQDADAKPSPQDFIPAPDGGLDYGEITPEMGKAMRRQTGKIRLQQGDASFGLVHIEQRHGAEIRKAGFESIQAFVSGAVADIESIWKPEATSQLVVIQATERGKVVFIQLQAGKDDSGDFYTVRTAFPSSMTYAEKRKEWKQLWSRVPVPAADAGKSAPSAELGNEAGSKSTMESGQSDAASVPATAAAAQPDTPKLTQPEAKALMAWQDLGQKDGVKTHILTFYENQADKDAKRGRMTVATVSMGDRSATAWTVDGDDKTFGALSLAKKRAEEIGMAKAVADGYVERLAAGREVVDTSRDQRIGKDINGNDVFMGTDGALRGVPYIFDERGRPKTGVAMEGSAKAAAPAAPIEDAGEKIGGARKDRWKERGLNLDDLDAMTEAEGAELATKANVWKPDYEALSVASEPVTAALVKTIYDQLAAKPKKNTPEGRRQYVQMMRIVRDVYTEAKGPEAVKNAYLEIRKRAGLNAADPAAKSAGRELMFSVYKGRSDPFVLGYTEMSKAKKLVEDGFPAKADPWKSRLSVSRMDGGPGTTERGIEIYVERSAEVGTPLTREQILAGFYRVNTKDSKTVAYAPTKADAEAAAATIYERDMKGKKDGKPEPVRPNLDELKRENLPQRIDRDVTSEDFVRDLGFRGVEFGNWSAQDERQRILNMAYDGLMDLAEIMGVPPKAMSLNGTLGMAFGARGGGRFAAHYEPGKLVINMTKIRGGGSMAHEWAHAMDHYFGELDKADAYTTQARGASGWYSEAPYTGQPITRMERVGNEWKSVEKMRLDNLRPEMAAAFDEVMRALFQKQITKAEMVRSQELDLERTEALVRNEQDAEMKAMYQRMVQNKREALNELRNDPEGRLYAGRGRSDYAKQAQALSGKSVDGYWVRPTEMFARAFESWVFDRVTAMGARSDYLVHGVEEDRFAGGGYKGNPYPTGEERARINAAFDKLASTIKTKQTDKGVVMFSRAQPAIRSAAAATPAATIRAAITKAYGKLLGQLESKGLVTLTQTQEQAIEAAARARADKTGQPLADVRASLMGSVSNSVATDDLDIRRSANGAIQGFFDPQTGQSFLIADNLTAEAAPGVLMHEVGIHMAADGSMKALFNRAAMMLKMQRGNPFMKAVQARMDAAGETSGEEAAAYIAEAYENDRANAPASVQRWLTDLLAAVKAWMFKKGIMGADRLTVADIAAVARANARSMARGDGATGGQGFGPAFSVGEEVGAKALAEFAKADELFALPKSSKDTVKGIAADNDPLIKVSDPKNIAGRIEYTLTMPDDTEATLSVREPNPYGDAVYDMISTDEGMEAVVGRPGENPDDVPPTGDVWINVADFTKGEYGAAMYNIAATYAHNTGRIFIGDPYGLSKVALHRRLEQMISSALKFGTTAHLAPHPDQTRGGDGVPPLRWVYGDHVGNVERMIAASVKALDNGFPQSKMIEYRDDGNFYNAKSGKLLPRGRLAYGLARSIREIRGQDRGDGSTGQAGWRTVARAVLFRYLQSKSAIGSDGVPERGSLLDLASTARAGLRSDGSAGTIGSTEERKTRIFYSRTADAGSVDEGAGARIGAAIKSVTVTNIKQRAGFKLTDYLGIGLQALGRRQIVDIYGDMLPLGEYNRLVQQMEADKNEGSSEADQLVKRWAKLEDEGKLADLMHDATLAQIDPAEDFVEGDDKGKYLELRRKYNLLSDDAKKVYADTRDSYKAHHAKVRSAIKERIERSEIKGERKAALLKQMDDEFFKAIKGVYFPLARFGQYAVTVKGPDGKVESVSRAETKAEAEALRSNLLSAFPRDKGFTVGRVMLSKDFIADRDAVGRGFMTELYQVLDQQNMDAAQRAELEDTLGQLYLSSLPDLSWAKHGIHRKGTPGFSQDARRAFAQNMFHGARYLAKLRYSDLMQDELTAMQRHVDDWREVEDFDQNSAQRVVDEMNKRHESLMNPTSNPLSTALTSLGFVFHLGLSPASAMVNLSQTALVAYPIMGAKWGFNKASAALLKASKEAAAGKNDITGSLNADERAAYDEAVRAGTIDVTMAHDLAGIAQGEDAGVMWKIRPVMRYASFLFHHAERFNRQVTFVAAYRLAREAGADHKAAFDQATKATYDGHFDYGAANRPRIMQGNVAKVLLLFKQYGQNMVYTLARNAQQAIKAETPEARAQARKALGGLLATHAMAAGVLGLPMVTTLLAAASMVGGDDDDPWDAKVALQNMLADTFGQKPAEVLAHGLSRLTPWDISGRVGLDRLIFPDVQEGLEGQRLAESAMAAALGPVAGIGVNVLKGAQHMSEGRYAMGLEAMMPSALRGPVKALRYANEGVQDKSGVSILDEVSPAAVAGQALGFSPSQARNAQEGKSAVMAHDRALGERRQELLSKAARASMEKDADARAKAMKEIERFNQKNPTRRITPLNVLQSVRNRNKRIEQAEGGIYLPKARRDAMGAGRFAVGE